MTAKQMTPLEVETLQEKAHLTLGQGTFGSVYLVEHFGVQCALKIGGPYADVASLEEECKIMEHLEGAGGAPLALGICSEVLAIVMSYRGKKDLVAWLFDKPAKI